MAKVTLPTGTHTLTKAQALALVATTSNSAIITGLGPLTIRWNRASGNTGLIDGVDLLFNQGFPTNRAPIFIALPTMSMTGTDLDVGVAVACSAGATVGADRIEYQWEVNGEPIYVGYGVRAISPRYVIQKGLQWMKPRCKVTAYNAFGSTVAYSNDLGRVTVDFSKNTRAGHGALPLGLGSVTISSGTNASDFTIASGSIIPSGTKNAAKTFAGTRYTLTLSDGTIVKLRIVDDGFTVVASSADSIYDNELKYVVETTGAAGMKLGYNVWCRTSNNIWNPLSANWGLDVPATGFAAGTGTRVTIRSEFVDYQLDANGNNRNQHGFKTGRIAVYAQAAIDCKLNFENIWFNENNNSGTARVLLGFGGTYTTTASGLGVYNSRFEVDPAVVPDIFGVRSQGRSEIIGNVFTRLGTAIQIDNTAVAGSGVSVVQYNCGYGLRSDHIDFKGDNVLIEFNWCFDWIVYNPLDHKDFIQDFGNKTSGTYSNVKVRMNFTARNLSTAGYSDSQGIFFADSISTATNNYEVINNGVINTDTKGVVICKFGAGSKVKGNATLNDWLATDVTIANPCSIYIPPEDPGVGGDFSLNTAHAFNFSAQTGSPTVSNNTVISPNWNAIRVAFPNMPSDTRAGTLCNLESLMKAFVPADLAVASGGTRRTDGRFTTPFFPDGSENDFAPYVPGRLQPIVSVSSNVAVQTITPSSSWNGTEGTGFGGANEAEPTPSTVNRLITDPAKGIGGYFTGDREAFIANHKLHVLAFAAGGSTVKFVVEGRAVTVTAPTPSIIKGGDGVDRTAWTYSVEIDWAACTTDGWIKWYAIIIPNNPAIQQRVLPAQMVKRRTGTLHDSVLTFGPGGTYANVKLALEAAGATGLDHVKLTCATSHTFDPAISWGADKFRKGLVDISPEPGVTLTIKTNTQGNAPQFRAGQEGTRWNKGVKFDVQWISALFIAEVAMRQPWYNGCEIMSSGGQYELPGTIMRDTAGTTRDVFAMKAGAFMTEVYIHDTFRGPTAQQLVRWCRIENVTEDVLTSTLWTWTTYYGNVIANAVNEYLRTPLDAMTVNYTGDATTATVSVTGAIDASSRRLELRENGTVVRSSAISTTWGSGIYSMSDLVADGNLQAGWTFTLLSNARRAAAIGGLTPPTNLNVKSVTVTLGAAYDVHGDIMQLPNSSHMENICYVNNTGSNLEGMQFIFAQAGAGGICDVAFINNAASFPVFSGSKSQFSGGQSHVITWHNSILNQDTLIRPAQGYTVDAFCETYGNVFTGVAWDGTPNALAFVNNHITSGVVPTGSKFSNNTSGGSLGAIIPGYLTGDFAPSGTILTDRIIPKVPFDKDGNVRGNYSARGAVESIANLTSIDKNNLRAVANLNTTVGLTGVTLTKTPAANSADLPAFTNISGSQIYLPSTGTSTLSNWDFSGYTVYVNGTTNYTFNNCKFAGAAYLLVSIGENSGIVTAAFNNCLFDSGSCAYFYESTFMNYAGNVTFTRCKFTNCPLDFISHSANTVTLVDCYFDKLGQRAPSGAHIEAIHSRSGTVNMTRVFMDFRNGHGPLGDMTGIVYPDSDVGATNWNITNCILIGSRRLASVWGIQFGGKAYPATVNINGSVMDPGTSGHFVRESNATLTGSGNLDYDTALPIVLP